ncbi:MAG: lipoate--protein ligase [Bacteroidaceae bacterium]|nr:lipoate--protein ligase [Bacteroidaceae bacterium]
MLYVTLPRECRRKLPFYLALEEFVARELPAGNYFFMWQVEPTVIFGRNQLLESEVDINFCRNNNIEIFRRKSGGGCVYADQSNIMLSFITSDSNVNSAFNSYMLLIEHALRKLGIDAKSTGRNDILIDGKKVSGSAFYHLHNRSIVHGTMLYDTDIEMMASATTPSDSKLKSKGVESVRQHVTTLNRYISLPIEDFMQFMRTSLCGNEQYHLTDVDIERIIEIEQEYHSSEFLYGHNPAYTVTRSLRIEGVGEFTVGFEVKNDKVRKVSLSGDFFHVDNRIESLLQPLVGVVYERNALLEAVGNIEPSGVIVNMNKEQLETLIKNFF